MRKHLWINLLVALVLLLSACATSVPTEEAEPATEEPAPTEEEKETEAPEPTDTPEPTEEPEEEEEAEPEEEEPEEEATPETRYNESPMLTELVNAGELPPVDERLPISPRIVEPLVEIGEYGGELQYGFTGSPTWGGMLYIAAWEHPVQWTADSSDYVANIIEDWEVNDTATEYVWYLRKGLKWSTGDPYNADDILFYVNDFMKNEELSPGGTPITGWLPEEQVDGFAVEKIDDYTVKFIFPQPYGTFMMALAPWAGRFFAMFPDEYLKQFHADYNPDVDDLVAANDQAEDWTALFLLKAPNGNPAYFFDEPELPTLGPYVVKQPLGAGTTVIMERNPYYFKVDPEGNQLPYIDRVVATLYQDSESRTFAMMNGDLDFIKDAGDANRELYFDAMDQGNPIEIRLPKYDLGNMQSIHFNLTTKDPVQREIFNNKDFRIGMSHAINRAEIIEVVFKGQGEPVQVCPYETSPFYNEQLCNQYVEFDQDLANEYLDEVMPEKDAEGYRLRPDGERFNPVFTVRNDDNEGQHWVQVAEILIEQWKEVGVEVLLNSVSGQVAGEQRTNNDIEMFLFHGGEGGSGMTAILDPRWHVPGAFHGYFGLGWTLWLADPEDPNAVEPPDYVMDIRELYKFATQQPTVEGQIEVMQEVMQKSADNFWTIGITRAGTTIQPISTRLGNIPEEWLHLWTWGFTKIIYPEQWYIKQ